MNKELAQLCIRSYVEETWRSDGDTEVLLDTISQRQCLAFRGTEFSLPGWRDIVSDLRFAPWYDERVGWCRKGFLRASQSIWPHIVDFVMRPETPIVLTGHSLGGAVACITAKLMLAYGKVPTALVTFGCPKPGWAELIKSLDEISQQAHFYNLHDLVVEVPFTGTSPTPRINAGGRGHKMSEYAAGPGVQNT